MSRFLLRDDSPLNDPSLFTPTTEATHVGEPRKCAHPKPYRRTHEGGGWACGRCPKVVTPEASRRGRTSRNRGNSIEREIGKRLGMRRVGQYGGPDDLRSDEQVLSDHLFAAQVKSGGAYPERLDRWLRAVPVNAGQTAILVITDAPGAGYRRRALVVLDIDDWRALHGQEGPL